MPDLKEEPRRAAPSLKERFRRVASSLSERFVIYLYPLFLVMIEIFLRLALKTDIERFLGPTLASTGVGLVLPLTIYRGQATSSELPVEIPEEIRKAIESLPKDRFEVTVTSKRAFANWCLVFTIILTGIWLASLYLSAQSGDYLGSSSRVYLAGHY